MTENKIFVTAGFGKYAGCAKRISKQASKTNCFSKIHQWSTQKLMQEESFWLEHKNFINKKTGLTLEAMRLLDEDDIELDALNLGVVVNF